MIELLLDLLLGKKYFLVLFYNGVHSSFSSTIFPTREDAKNFGKKRLKDCLTIEEYKVISFRGKNITLMPKL